MAVKETMEALAAWEAEIVALEAVVADGKLGLLDLIDVLKTLPVLLEGVLGVVKIPAEIMGATLEDRTAIALKVMDLIPRSIAGIKALVFILQTRKAKG